MPNPEQQTKPDAPPTIDRLIREGLHKLGYGGQSRVADAVGVRTATVGKWAAGHTVPKSDKWAIIERELALPRGSIERSHQASAKASPDVVIAELIAAVAGLTLAVDTLDSRLAALES